MNLFKNPQKQKISDLNIGSQFQGYYKVEESVKRLTRAGSPYLTITLSDPSGRVTAKKWSCTEEDVKSTQKGNIYLIKGIVTEYNDKPDLKIDTISEIPSGAEDFNPEEFKIKAGFDTQKVLLSILDLVDKHVTCSFTRNLISIYLEEYGDRLKNHYGAQKIHHSYPGGLLEHTFAVMEMGVKVAEKYSLNKNLVIAGALFHDAGKIEEFSIEPAVSTSLAGGLIGHVVISYSILTRIATTIDNFPTEILIKLQHMVLSHHGEKEYGSPEIPKFPEAYALHLLDMLDSKMQIFKEMQTSSESQELFSEYSNPLGRRILIDKKD